LVNNESGEIFSEEALAALGKVEAIKLSGGLKPKPENKPVQIHTN
jgi:hypothetical protein